MRILKRRLISLTLSLTVATQTFLPSLAFAHDSQKANELSKQQVVLPEADFTKVPVGQPREALPQDQFLLWMQTVYPSQVPAVGRLGGEKLRLWKLSSLIQKTDAMIKAVVEDKVRPTKYAIIPDNLDDAKLKAAIMEWIDKGRKIDTPLFLWNRQKDLDELAKVRLILTEMADKWITAKNQNGLNPTDAPMNTKIRYLNWWELSVHLQTSDRQIGEISLKETAPVANSISFDGLACSTEDCRFNLKVGSNYIHSFGIPIRSIVNLGPYLVFTHPDSYDAEEGFQYLNFIDLEAYEASLGNEDLPVFRYLAPIQGKGPLTRLSVAGGKLYADGEVIANIENLKLASTLQQTSVNLQANLLDPNRWKDVLAQVDSFDLYSSKMINAAIETAKDDFANQDRTFEGLRVLGQDIAKDLREIRDAKTAVEVVDQKISKQTEEISKTLSTITKRGKDAHLYMSGVSRLIQSLWSPRPYASQIIKQAVGASLARAQINAPDKDKLNWLYRLADRPFLNAGVIGYTMMALGAPEAFHNHVETVLQFGSSLANYFMFASSGIGESLANGTAKTLQAVYSPIDTLFNQYGIHGKWKRTAIAVPTFVGFLLSIYFSGHVAFNLKELWKDKQRPGYKGFRERQTQFYNAYFQRIAEAEAKERQTDVVFSPEELERIGAYNELRKQESHEAEQKAISRRLFYDSNGVSYWAFTKAKFRPVSNAVKAGGRAVGTGVAAIGSTIGAGYSAIRGLFSNREAQAQQPQNLEQHDHDVVALTADQSVEDLESGLEAVAQSEVVKKAAGLSEVEFKTRWAAIKSFMFSMPSLDLTLGTWIRVWNGWAGWRFCTAGWCSYRVPYTDYPFIFRPKPVSLALRVAYPRLFDTAVAARKGSVTLPTDLNGGNITRFDSWGRRFSAMAKLLSSSGEEFNELLRPVEDKYANAQAAFEDQIIDVEQKVIKVAFQAALRGLVNFAKDPKDLQILFGGHGINHLTDEKVRELSRRSQTYLRTHFEAIYEEAMGQFMREAVASDDSEDLTRQFLEDMARKAPNSRVADEALAKLDSADELVGVPDELTFNAMKSMVVSAAEIENRRNFNFDVSRAEALAQKAALNMDHVNKAIEQSKKIPDLDVLMKTTRYNFISSIDPVQNRSMARYAQVDERLEKPLARSRAVRAEVAKLLVTLPFDVGFKLFLTAAVLDTSFTPLQEHLWGENSTFYLSHTAFYGSMGAGFAMGMMADAWMKLQQDARQDNMKLFGEIPKGEDAERSFLRFYFKQMGAPENSLWANYKYSNFLSFWNMPAAMVNIGLFYTIFMGRVDLSMMAAMYMLGYLTPFGGLSMKLDQAFERSVYYAYRGVENDKWLAHPDLVSTTSSESQRLRNRFQLLNDIYGNVQGNWAQNLESVPTVLGPRGLVRAAFMGWMPEERIVNGIIRPLGEISDKIPVIGSKLSTALSSCETLLTKGNTDLIKIRK